MSDDDLQEFGIGFDRVAAPPIAKGLAQGEYREWMIPAFATTLSFQSKTPLTIQFKNVSGQVIVELLDSLAGDKLSLPTDTKMIGLTNCGHSVADTIRLVFGFDP